MSKINEISNKSKEKILSALNEAYEAKDFTYQASIDPVEHIQTKEDALAEMKQKMSDNKYIVENATKETLEEKINEIITKYNYKKDLIFFNFYHPFTLLHQKQLLQIDIFLYFFHLLYLEHPH